MAIDPSAVSLVTLPQLDTEGLTLETLFAHQVVGGVLKKGTMSVLVAFMQANMALSTKLIITKSQFDILEESAGSGLWYVEFKDESGAALGATVRPFSVESVTGAVTTPIPALLHNNTAWAFPRIYGFPDPTNTQAIKIYAL